MKGIIAILLAAVFATTLEAQDTTRTPRDSAVASPRLYRNPQLAQVLGTIIPGAGHFYTGEYLRGYGTWVVTLGGFSMGPFIYHMDSCTLVILDPCQPGRKWPYHLVGAFMVGTGVWAWISSARDAPHAAERANERHRLTGLKVIPLVEPSAEPDPELRAGIAIRW